MKWCPCLECFIIKEKVSIVQEAREDQECKVWATSLLDRLKPQPKNYEGKQVDDSGKETAVKGMLSEEGDAEKVVDAGIKRTANSTNLFDLIRQSLRSPE